MKNLLTTKEAADILGISPLTLRRWDKKDKLKAKRHPFNNYRIYQEREIRAIAKKINSKK